MYLQIFQQTLMRKRNLFILFQNWSYELIRTFSKNIPFAKLKIVFKSGKRLSSCFLFKDKFPKSLMSSVIYKYTCATCNRCYIGCTKRFWEKRLEEHVHVSALTGKPLNGMQIFTPLHRNENFTRKFSNNWT